MSTLKVDTIQKADGTGSLSVPADTGSLVTTAAGSVESAMTTQFGRRNLIINGAMQVAQRGTSFSSVSSGTFTLDRWKHVADASGKINLEQNSDSPSGFGSSMKITSNSAYTAGTTEEFRIDYQLEGQDIQSFKWGTSDAADVTLSFWVKGSLTGTYYVAFRTTDGTQYIYPASYEINSANTWEYKTITVSGQPSATIDNDNAVSLRLMFMLDAGSYYHNTADTWTTSTSTRCGSDQTNFLATSGATFQITGVQLEVGSVATPFEHRSYGEELALCQRYYQRYPSTSSGNGVFEYGHALSATACRYLFSPQIPLRASPTFTISNVAPCTPSGTRYNATGSGLSTSSGTTIDFNLYVASGLTTNNPYFVRAQTSQDGYIAFDAEL